MARTELSALPLFRVNFLSCAIIAEFLALLLQSPFVSAIRRQSGTSLSLIAERAPPVLHGLAVVALAGLVAGVWFQKPWNMQLAKFAQRVCRNARLARAGSLPGFSLRTLVGIVVLGVVVFDGLTLIWGHFETDDYHLLIYNRLIPFPEILVTTHNDHSLPLLRLEVWLMQHFFGSQALFYNVAILVSFACMLTAASLLLVEMGAIKSTVLLFLAICLSWTLWCDFTTGEYILQKYMQITTAGLFAVWSALRWQRRQQWRYVGFSVACVAFAGAMNVSGLWVPCAWFVVTFFEMSGQKNRSVRDAVFRMLVPGGLIIATVFAVIGLHAYVYQRPSSAEFLSLAEHPLSPGTFCTQFIYTLGSLLISLGIPLPHHLGDFKLLTPGLVVALLTGGGFLATASVLADRQGRAMLLAMLIVAAGILSMVCLGRPTPGLSYYVPNKFLGPIFVWLCIALAWSWQLLASVIHERYQLLFVKTTLLLTVNMWILHSTSSILGAVDTPFFEATRGGKLVEHAREMAALRRLRNGLFNVLERGSRKHYQIPQISGAAVCSQFPVLRFPWGEEPPLSTFIDVLTDDPRRFEFITSRSRPANMIGVRRVDDLRTATSPEFLQLIPQSVLVRSLVEFQPAFQAISFPPESTGFQESELRSAASMEPRDFQQIPVVNGQAIVADLDVRKYFLALDAEFPGAGPPSPDFLMISFVPEWSTSSLKIPAQITSQGRQTVGVDLRESLAFALGAHVRNLTIQLASPTEPSTFFGATLLSEAAAMRYLPAQEGGSQTQHKRPGG